MTTTPQQEREAIKTCPASRHAMMIAEDLQNKRHPLHKLLSEAGYEPEHMGESIQCAVDSLWHARQWMKWERFSPSRRHPMGNGRWVPDADAIKRGDHIPQTKG